MLLVVAEWPYHPQPTITRDLEEMQKKGYGGVLLVDANGANQNGNDNVPAGPEFGKSGVDGALCSTALNGG